MEDGARGQTESEVMIMMNPERDLPLGFGMALAQHQEALIRFGQMSHADQEALIAKAHQAQSKAEMHALVESIAP